MENLTLLGGLTIACIILVIVCLVLVCYVVSKVNQLSKGQKYLESLINNGTSTLYDGFESIIKDVYYKDELETLIKSQTEQIISQVNKPVPDDALTGSRREMTDIVKASTKEAMKEYFRNSRSRSTKDSKDFDLGNTISDIKDKIGIGTKFLDKLING